MPDGRVVGLKRGAFLAFLDLTENLSWVVRNESTKVSEDLVRMGEAGR